MLTHKRAPWCKLWDIVPQLGENQIMLWTYRPEPTPADCPTGEDLRTEFLVKGYAPRTVSAMACLPLGMLTHFYRRQPSSAALIARFACNHIPAG